MDDQPNSQIVNSLDISLGICFQTIHIGSEIINLRQGDLTLIRSWIEIFLCGR